MKIGNRSYTKKEVLKKVGNISQLGGTRHYKLKEGSSKGVYAVDFDTGSGFRFTVLPDRGLDICGATYKGVNLVYRTPNGEVNSAFYESKGFEWLKTFFGGLLTTCGLTYFGAPGKDGNEELGLHGRYTNIPAKQVCDNSGWEKDEYLMSISGVVEECSIFGDKLRMTRSISTMVGNKSLVIKDCVENFGYKESPFTILYHINAGFPLLDSSSFLLVSAKEVEPYNKNAEDNIKYIKRFSEPIPKFEEQNFLHKMETNKNGYGYAAMVNPCLSDGKGIGLYIKFCTDNLPYISEWKMMGESDYVVGIEPCNVKILNRAELRKKGTLPFLKPGEKKNIYVEIGVLEGKNEINSFKKLCVDV